ncbi:hypothetical protein TRFO_11785 [Tritrichomonas foetus]|uniref:Phosphoribulokinase/uridine kinase domain-containing protein n=1 Tax=Tritrichomonas foetus TaxID=1144522 RepID=A0A1J4J1Y7_9EUKA|nr:hypothetical protein TRFO_11785 [Tritrichomonas foetus]|eukprot:OHS93386.1 hypothetical protein TRFO_11785 [Tritrichomonas foetus]
MSEYRVFAFTGPSTSGKSTLVQHFAHKYNAVVLNVDAYFKRMRDMPPIELDTIHTYNNDCPESVEWKLLLRNFQQIPKNRIIFLDGFILFCEEFFINSVDVLINIEYDFNKDFKIALNRRFKRIYFEDVPADIKSYKPTFHPRFICDYFEQIVWKEAIQHPEYRKPSSWEKPPLTLNATDPLATTVENVDHFLKRFIYTEVQSHESNS